MALPPPSCTINVRATSLWRVQVPPHQGAGADRRRPAGNDQPRRARHGDAGLVRPAAQRSPGRDSVHQVRAGGGPLGSAEALCLFRRGAAGRAAVYRRAPPPSAEIVAHGKEVWQQAKCWECHGQTGKGDGEKAAASRTISASRSGPRSDRWTIQIGTEGRRHLQDPEHRPERHADAHL